MFLEPHADASEPNSLKTGKQKTTEYQPKNISIASVLNTIRSTLTFKQVIPAIEREVLDCFSGERLSIYQRDTKSGGLLTRYSSGGMTKAIRLPLSNSSLAGFVALSGRALNIANVRDQAELKRVHPQLRFDERSDRRLNFVTKSVIAVPITHQRVVLGVLQLINKLDESSFNQRDMREVTQLAQALAQRYRKELYTSDGPYDLLLRTSRLSRERLEELTQQAKIQQSNVPRLILADSDITLAEIGASLEMFYHVPFVSFNENHVIPKNLLDGINPGFLEQELWVPLDRQGDKVVILMSDPLDQERIQHIQSLIPASSYVLKVGVPDDIYRYLGTEIGLEVDDNNLADYLGNLDALEVEPQDRFDNEPDNDVYNENQSAIIGLVNQMILEAYKGGASDIHLEPSKAVAAAVVRYRVDGACKRAIEIPGTHIRAVVARIKVMSGLDISERRLPQDGRCAIRYRGKKIEVRVATLPTVHGESVVLRILATNDALPLDAINLSQENAKRVARLVRKTHGLFLVVGPTGSGKTTTLHSLLSSLNAAERKIWTAEDPVEITQQGLQQVQVQPKIGLDFSSALRAFLRADPDVIMIGEMRDLETASTGVEASLTGHLVLSTLHTNSAPETLTRLMDIGLDPASFSDAMLGVLAQRLIRTLCNACKSPYQPSQAELKILIEHCGIDYFRKEWDSAKSTILYESVGCDSCGGSGYQGRTGIHELLTGSAGIRALISRRAPLAEIRDQAQHDGMRTLLQDGIDKIFLGQTDYSQLQRVMGI